MALAFRSRSAWVANNRAKLAGASGRRAGVSASFVGDHAKIAGRREASRWRSAACAPATGGATIAACDPGGRAVQSSGGAWCRTAEARAAVAGPNGPRDGTGAEPTGWGTRRAPWCARLRRRGSSRDDGAGVSSLQTPCRARDRCDTGDRRRAPSLGPVAGSLPRRRNSSPRYRQNVVRKLGIFAHRL